MEEGGKQALETEVRKEAPSRGEEAEEEQEGEKTEDMDAETGEDREQAVPKQTADAKEGVRAKEDNTEAEADTADGANSGDEDVGAKDVAPEDADRHTEPEERVVHTSSADAGDDDQQVPPGAEEGKDAQEGDAEEIIGSACRQAETEIGTDTDARAGEAEENITEAQACVAAHEASVEAAAEAADEEAADDEARQPSEEEEEEGEEEEDEEEEQLENEGRPKERPLEEEREECGAPHEGGECRSGDAASDKEEVDDVHDDEEFLYLVVCPKCGATRSSDVDFMGLGLEYTCGLAGVTCDGPLKDSGRPDEASAESSVKAIVAVDPARPPPKLTAEERAQLCKRYAVELSKADIRMEPLRPESGSAQPKTRYRNNQVVTHKGERFV